MEKTIDLNSSFMSTASAISAIGLESTMTEEFQELKAFQAEVSHQVDRVVDYFERVKDIVVDELKNGRSQYVQSIPGNRPIFVSSKKTGIEGNSTTFQGAS